MNYYSEKLNTANLQRCYQLATPRIRQLLAAETEFVLRHLTPRDTVLELGCGYGRVAGALCGKARKVVGIDISRCNIDMANTLFHQTPNIEFHVMNAAAMDFPDAMFDITVCVQNGISSFREDPLLLLEEATRVTKKGGTILFSSYSDKIWSERLRWFQIQADEGLLGEIDYDRTANGVIVCKDGFTATTFSGADFLSLAAELGLSATIHEVDESTVFCRIKK